MISKTGNDIRALRKAADMTIADLAAKLDRSIGFVSQLERGKSEPSLGDLRKVAEIFNVPVSFFFGKLDGDPSDRGFVVRASNRRRLGGAEDGLVEELLSPDLGGQFEILRCEFSPHGERKQTVQRDSEDAGYLVSGRLEIEIDGKWLKLAAGDSFRFAGEPYRWRNTGDETAVVIWVVSPPVY